MRLQFNTLTLRNFASFASLHEFQLDRGPGLYFITGKNNVEPALTTNGCGKSTLFNSLYWVLTGKTLRQQRPGAAVESWYDKGTVSVTLEMMIDDQPYTITRTRKPNSLTINGTVVEQTAVNKLIRLNEDTLKRTIIVGQFVPLFLELKAEQQSALFSEVLGLDVWLKAAESATAKSRELERQGASLELKRATASGQATQVNLHYELEVKREEAFESQKADRLAELHSLIGELQAELSAATEAFQAAYSDANANVPRSPCDDEIRSQRAAYGKFDALAHSISTELRISQNTQKSLENRLARYQSSNSYCPECGQLVDAQHILTKTNDLLFEISQSTQIQIKINRDYVAAKTNLDTAKQYLYELELERDEYIANERERYDAKSDIDAIKSELNTAVREFDQLKNATNPYAESCEKLANDYCLLTKQIEKLEQQIEAIAEEASIYKLWATAYREIRLNLIDETLAELELASNRHIEVLGLENWRIEFRTERENKSGTISHTFTTLIYPSGQANPIAFESYSGGESQRLQLAVTAALSEILLSRAGIDTNIEIYDESSKALSREGIVDLLECLKERAFELQRSIYFVDHTMLESGFFDSIITIEKNPYHGSRIIIDVDRTPQYLTH